MIVKPLVINFVTGWPAPVTTNTKYCSAKGQSVKWATRFTCHCHEVFPRWKVKAWYVYPLRDWWAFDCMFGAHTIYLSWYEMWFLVAALFIVLLACQNSIRKESCSYGEYWFKAAIQAATNQTDHPTQGQSIFCIATYEGFVQTAWNWVATSIAWTIRPISSYWTKPF